MNPLPEGYTQSADGLFRRRVTFETNKPGVVQVKVLTRTAEGQLVRMAYREDRIRLSKAESYLSGLKSVVSGEIKTGKTTPGSR